MMLQCETLLVNYFNLFLLSFLPSLPIYRTYPERFFFVCVYKVVYFLWMLWNGIFWCQMVMEKPFNILAEITPINWLLSLMCGIWTEITVKELSGANTRGWAFLYFCSTAFSCQCGFLYFALIKVFISSSQHFCPQKTELCLLCWMEDLGDKWSCCI